MNLKALLEKRASLQKEQRAIHEKIAKEVRAMSEDEAKQWDTLKSEIAAITRTVEELQAARELEENGEEHEEGGTPTETDEQRTARETRAFANYLRNIISTKKEDRADTNLTTGDNGALIPKTIASKIVAKVYDVSPVVEKATKYVTKGTLEIPVYGANGSADITVAYQQEFQELEANIGKFTSVELQNYLAGALVKLSNSLINNTDVDLVNFAVERIGYEVARFLEGEILIGTNGKILGLRTLEAGQKLNTAVVGTVSPDDLIALKNKVKAAFRKGSIWIMSGNTKTAIEQMKDANDRYLFNNNVVSEFDGELLGYPVFVSDKMADVANGATPVHFGDFSGVALKWSEQLEIQVLREKYATQHATGVVAWLEADAKVENNQKLASLVVKAS